MKVQVRVRILTETFSEFLGSTWEGGVCRIRIDRCITMTENCLFILIDIVLPFNTIRENNFYIKPIEFYNCEPA